MENQKEQTFFLADGINGLIKTAESTLQKINAAAQSLNNNWVASQKELDKMAKIANGLESTLSEINHLKAEIKDSVGGIAEGIKLTLGVSSELNKYVREFVDKKETEAINVFRHEIKKHIYIAVATAIIIFLAGVSLGHYWPHESEPQNQNQNSQEISTPLNPKQQKNSRTVSR
jgi:seryl-tRNA synthetase